MTQPRVRTERRPVHGVLLLEKPLGQTSNQALQQAKRLYRADKAGHTGTLDPLASGLLPICFGAATKFAQASLDADKTYRATLKLGERTASFDGETPVIERHAISVSRDQVDEACRRFIGDIEQLPPMYSALKKDGKALYDYARAGQQVARDRRQCASTASRYRASTPTAWCSTWRAPRAPTSVPWPTTWARRWAAVRTSPVWSAPAPAACASKTHWTSPRSSA
jgi:tRNA pseudouridine(55) synthase